MISILSDNFLVKFFSCALAHIKKFYAANLPAKNRNSCEGLQLDWGSIRNHAISDGAFLMDPDLSNSRVYGKD